MKINWKVRFKNPLFIISLMGFIISTAYQGLAMFDITPNITQELVTQIISGVVQALTLLGVLIDPTTAGIGDSKNALTYTELKKD